jgi:dipeptidyl aminopeptidase/acylaminoacyl peptidase
MSRHFGKYLNIRSASSGSLRDDGQRLAFLSDITGTSQVWVLDGPERWPDQLTYFEDRVMFAAYHPNDPVITFGKDRGGDERQRIFAIDDAGGPARRLSQTDAKHLWGSWAHGGDRAAWSHNGRNGKDFDLFVYDRTTDTESCVLETDGWNYVVDWMPGDGALLVGCANANVDNDLWLLDLEDGSRQHLTPHEGDAFFGSPAPTPDGQTIYMLTNRGRDKMSLARWERSTGKLEVLESPEYERESVAIDEEGRWLLVGTNVDGYSKLEIRDLRGEQPSRTVDGMSNGVVSGVTCGSDTGVATTTYAPANDTADIWTIDIGAEEIETRRWTRSAAGGLERSGFRGPELITYSSFDDLEIPGFYYTPDDVEPPYPVIIDIHGGPEAQHRPQLRPTTQYFISDGFAVLAPNVRGSAGYGQAYMSLDDVRNRMDSVADIKAARNWLVEEGGADPESIGLTGGSYGGFMVLASMVTYPELWAAGVDIVGIASLVTFLENTSDYRRHLREAEYGSLDEDREFLAEISPLNQVDQIAAPLMVIHGRNDPRVPASEAEQIAEAVTQRGIPCELLIYEDEGHGLAKRENRLDAYPRVADFFDRHLR